MRGYTGNELLEAIRTGKVHFCRFCGSYHAERLWFCRCWVVMLFRAALYLTMGMCYMLYVLSWPVRWVMGKAKEKL